MLEDYVAFYLQKYLGKYVKGVSKEALKISAWKGDVELKNMQLKPEALLELKLPIKVKAGFLGSVKLKVPWSRLGQEPVVVMLDRIFVLAEPSFKVEGAGDEAVQDARYQYIKEAETAFVNSMHEQSQTSEMSNTWLGSLIGTIISNIKLSVTNIHIRYEDTESNPEQPFAFGVTLEKLAGVTVDENGKEIFVSGGALDKINKSGELKRLAIYFDSKSKTWDLDWENLSPAEWSKVFEPGIHAEAAAETKDRKPHSFLLQPVDGMARYIKLGVHDERKPDKPGQSAIVTLEDVTLSLSEPQYRDVLKLVDNISAFNIRVQHAHYRPSVSIAENPTAWWHYAVKATTENLRKASGRLSWEQLLGHARLRKEYVSSYAKRLLSNPGRISINDDPELRELERELDKDVIVQWRNLAHNLADQARNQTADREKEQAKKSSSWWWLGWGGQSDGDDEPRGLSDEEWKQLNQAIGYQEGKPSTTTTGQDSPNALHTEVKVRMHHNATKLLSETGQELLTLSAAGLQCDIKLLSEAQDFGVKLESYKICSPEGLLAESASDRDALAVKFSYLPSTEDLDWSLSAEASPCYITYYKATVDRVVNFFSSRPAVSREVQLQTAAAFQMTLEEVARKTQQQFNDALRNRPRFSLLLDIAAPKITIPTEFYPRSSQQTKLMLDLGHFKMKTEKGEDQRISKEESDLYMCFKMQLNDVSAFLVDGNCDWSAVHSSADESSILPVIEKCAVFAALQQICVPHPLYPSTRIAVHVPSVAIHFSPARYHRLMQVVNVVQGSPGDTDTSARPWEPADFEGDLSVLTWKGLGNREAAWSHRHGALTGPFLYILESPSSTSYELCVNLVGKQVYMVPPETVGNVQHVLAVCDPNQFSKKVVESVSALILRFKDAETLNNWRVHLTAVIHKINSSQAVIRGKVEKDSDHTQHEVVEERETFFLTGALDELKICIGSNKEGHTSAGQILVEEEAALLELRAVGSKVEFVMRENEMAVGAALLSLEVEDKWYGATSPSCRFLARSTIVSPSAAPKASSPKLLRDDSSKERFFDSSDEFETEHTQEGEHSAKPLSRRPSSPFYDADSSFHDSNNVTTSFAKTPDLLPQLGDQRGLVAGKDGSNKTFIKAQVILSSPESPNYANIDKQVKVSLATLAFYLNRPTVVALLDFVAAINAEVETGSGGANDSQQTGDAQDVVSVISPADVHQSESGAVPVFDRKDSVVKGLLGTGKTRVVFLLILDMDRAQVVLNHDDGLQLATLAQDNLKATVKVFPSTYAITATLGNLRITDDSLSEGHPYYWLCDMRDPAGKSFVELEFVSYNEDDDDYEGYEFSLSGELSEVRVVYLHRFIQEISSYFMGLVPSDANYLVSLKDKVTDVEKTFTQSEVQGSPAMKLSLSLNKPIVILPKDTHSHSFLELDVLHIHVRNTFQWLEGGKEDIGGIRLETISLKVEDIHLVASVNGKAGENIIRDSSGLHVVVRRTLRDLRHQLPNIDVSVEVQVLKAALSDKEYQLMIDCCLSNLAENPKLSPPLLQQSSESGSKDKDSEEESSSSGGNSSESEVWTTMKLTVNVSLVELAIFVGKTENTPLASIQVGGLWAAYRMSTNEEMFVMASLDDLSVTDDRNGIEPELKVMVGKVDNVGEGRVDKSRLVMLVLDAKMSPDSQMITLRIQRPRVLLALDFLLAVAEVFIPSIADILPTVKSNDQLPHDLKNWIYLHKSPYFQEAEEVVLSPKHVLVADDEQIDMYIYDGGGGRIRLAHGDRKEDPLIIVGHGKALKFRNVIFENAGCLDRVVLLGSNSSYSVSEHDGVFLESSRKSSVSGVETDKQEKKGDGRTPETIFDLQAVGPELVMHTASAHSPLELKDRLLCAKMDVFSRLVMKGEDLDLTANINSLCVQGRRGLFVVEPVDASCKYSRTGSKQNVHATISDIVCNLTFSTLQLILKLQEDAQSFLLLTSKKLSIECTEFDRIWADEVRTGSSQIAFWRPRAPPGFAVLGDCLTVVDEPPSKGVVALNLSLVHVKKPVDFRLLWSSSSASDDDDSRACRVWLPIAPPGYVVLGCVASLGPDPPSGSSTLCILKQLVTQWYMWDCIYVKTPEEDWAFWRVNNSTGSFFPVSALKPPHNCSVYELRRVAFDLERKEDSSTVEEIIQPSEQQVSEESNLLLTTVTRFKLVWWDKGAKSKKSISIWRAVIPPGCISLGDLVVEGYEPPSIAFAPQDAQDGVLLQRPLKYVKMGVIHEKKGLKAVTFWFPVASPGYVALGCLASRGYDLDAEAADKLRCVRNDLVREVPFPASSLWNGRQVKHINEDISLWPLQVMDQETSAATFVINITQEAPPKHLAFHLKDLGTRDDADNLVGDGEIGRFSATLFDDFGGMMAPLLNLSLRGITASIHGTSDAMKATANFSLVSTTYNGRCDAWEPLIEPGEASVRFTRESPSLCSTISQVGLAATSDFNINASTANMNLLLEAYASWNKLSSIEFITKEHTPREGGDGKQVLQNEQEKKLQIVCHNELGQHLYSRILTEETKVKMVQIRSGHAETFKIPTLMSLQDPFTNQTVRRKSMTSMSLEMCSAELPKQDGLGGRQYTAAVRLVPQIQTANHHQLHYQSARTRCVNPNDDGASDDDRILLHWDETFIFEVEDSKSYTLEVLITDLAKGRAAGYCRISALGVFEGGFFETDLYRSASDQMNSRSPVGTLRLNIQFFNVGREVKNESLQDVQRLGLDPGCIQVAPSSDGPWTKLCLTLTSRSSYIKIGGDAAASELKIEDGVKHLFIKSLVTLKNNTSIAVEVSLFPHTVSQSPRSDADTLVEEVFENERYQPVVGWGSSWPGHLLPLDPGRWSYRNLGGSSQEFPNIELPLGWEWSSDWYVDMTRVSDADGWVYAFNFNSLTTFPPESSSQKLSFVRRRRWIRIRHKTSSLESSRCVLGVLKPGEALPMPLACFREARQDYYLQMRPQVGHGDTGYGWTQAVLCQTHGQKKLPTQEINVRSLLSEHSLSTALLESSSGSTSTKMWFCLDINYMDIGKDVYIGPIKDCQLILTAPLKIINHLPVSAEFKIFESSRVRGYRMQERGFVSSGETAEVHHADVRRPLYLSFVPEGSWHPVKEMVLVSHPLWEVAKYMMFENSSTKRRVKVHIEYDYEAEVIETVLRISVPFWIDCKCPPIRLKVLDIDDHSKSVCLPSSDTEHVIEEIPYDELNNRYTMISPFSPKTSGMAASLSANEAVFGAVSPLADLEKSDGTVELVATDGKEYFRLLISIALCPLRFAHTKVITIRPYVTFTNRYGETLVLKQCSQDDPRKLSVADWRTAFPISNANEPSMLQVRSESSQWSCPIELNHEETLYLSLQDEHRRKQFVRVEVRGYQEGSRFVVIFRRGSFRGPYRLENRTKRRKVRFRQLGTLDEDWEPLYPSSAKNFTWKNPRGQRVLELLSDGASADKSLKVEPDKLDETSTGDLRIQVLQLTEVKLVKLSDVEREEQQLLDNRPAVQSREVSSQLKVVVDIGKLGISIIDQRPQEIFYLYMENFKFSVLNSSQEKTIRYKFRVRYLQLDDQNMLSTSPVILAPDVRGLSSDESVLKSTMVLSNDREEGTTVYPYVGFWVTKRAWRVNIHEPVIWTAIGMYSNLQLDSLSQNTETVEADPEIRCNLVDLSEAHLRLTLQTEPGLRPRGVLGIWSPLVSLAGNTSKMPIHISGVTLENRYLRQSEVSTAIINHIRKDLVHQVFQLLFGVNVFGMASSTLETLSKGAADLSRDEKFQQVRLKQERLKHVSGVGDGLLRGGEALARGIAFGLVGVVTKPVDNAREHGVVGFIQGIGKAFTGFVFEPISGVLDFIALTVDGVNISYTRCFEVFSHDRTLTRVRLPRAIRGDGVLVCYDETAALGQAMLQLAEDHSFGQNVVFKEPAKFATTDFYEDHFEVPGNRVVMITNRRVMLLAQPSNYKSIRNVTPSNPCKILWEIPYMELLALEAAKGQSSSYIILHLRNDPKTFAQVIKCASLEDGAAHAEQVLASIQQRWTKYGPDRRTLFSQMRRWQQSRSMPTPRASKRVLVSDDERSRSFASEGQSAGEEAFTKEVFLFEQVWKSEQDSSVCCTTFSSAGSDTGVSCTIWRPIVPDGYVSIGDVAYTGNNPPTVTVAYKDSEGLFAHPVGFDLVWRNWRDGYEPVTIWKPKAPEGYETLGFVAVAGYLEPELDTVWCARSDIVEPVGFKEHQLWHTKYPWHCYIYQVENDALTFFVSREPKKSSHAAKRIAVRQQESVREGE